jgi:hypothetical protein
MQLSAARVQLKYNKETGVTTVTTTTAAPPPVARGNHPGASKEDEEFRDELLNNMERLVADKADLVRQLEEGRQVQQQQKRLLEAAKQQAQLDKFNTAAKERVKTGNSTGE